MAKFKKSFFVLVLFYMACLLPSRQTFLAVEAAPDLASDIAVQQTTISKTTVTSTTATTSTTQAKTINDIDSQNDKSKNIVSTTLESVFKADDATIWNTLVDFQKYPNIFKRVKSVEITKREGNLVYIESQLKPHLFVKKIVQYMVNDLSAAPKMLKWRMLDGNFKYVIGKWELQQRSPNSCLVRYTLNVDVGPIIPAALTNFVVHHIQQEIVADLQHYVESEYGKKQNSRRVAFFAF